jgi:hypothetical protein
MIFRGVLTRDQVMIILHKVSEKELGDVTTDLILNELVLLGFTVEELAGTDWQEPLRDYLLNLEVPPGMRDEDFDNSEDFVLQLRATVVAAAQRHASQKGVSERMILTTFWFEMLKYFTNQGWDKEVDHILAGRRSREVIGRREQGSRQGGS